MDIPKMALVCAARHFAAAHESACAKKPVDFGAVCAGCNEWGECRGDWTEAVAPIFETAGIHPQVIRPSEVPSSPVQPRTISEAVDEFIFRVLMGDCTDEETRLLPTVLDRLYSDTTRPAKSGGAPG